MSARNSSGFSAVEAGLGASRRLAKNSRYVYVDFNSGANVVYTDAVGGVAAVTAAALNLLLAEGETFEVRVEQTLLAAPPQVKKGARGLFFVTDAADNEGISIGLGQGNAGSETSNKGAFVVGTDAFFIRATLDVATVANSDQIAVGFFKGGWRTTGLFADHDDFAALNVDLGNIKVVTDVNNAGPATVDTTQDLGNYVTEANVVTLEVRVSLSGRVKFLINGAAPTVDVSSIKLDAGDTMQAAVYMLNAGIGTPGVTLRTWESGLISSRGLENINDLGDAKALV